MRFITLVVLQILLVFALSFADVEKQAKKMRELMCEGGPVADVIVGCLDGLNYTSGDECFEKTLKESDNAGDIKAELLDELMDCVERSLGGEGEEYKK
ncbi:unnamed protein product [Larinioides sclopetarius]|uniref:Uncharacterized protein n=1 Tax=Larinioides sclopetarius TaxID=280406 RepID=A0AAV1YV45_9ARAC